MSNAQGTHRATPAAAGQTPGVRLVPRVLVAAVLAGGTGAYVMADKAVQLTVDGQPRTVHTFADDVGGVLRRQGVAVGAHDIVAPRPDQPVHDGDEVAVRYGRPLSLTLDGRHQRIWTTGRTVAEALSLLGVRADGAYLNASRDASIGRHGLFLDVRTERTVTVLADGREHTVRTNAGTVRQAVADAGVTMTGQDTTSVDPDSFPRDGQTLSVLRITGREETHREPVPYRTVTQHDPALAAGTQAVVNPGRTGLRKITYSFRTVNGVRQRATITGSELERAPVDRVVRVGTRALPDNGGHGGSLGGGQGGGHGGGGPAGSADHLNWHGLAQCEAGGRPHAVDPTGRYGGLYQFDSHTWHSLGGHGRPQDAPAAEQTMRAKKLYVRSGSHPWPACGHRLHG